MKTAVAILTLLASACAAQSTDDDAPTAYNARECHIADGVWRVEKLPPLPDSECAVAVDRWSFDEPASSKAAPKLPSGATCWRHKQDLERGCHRSDLYICEALDEAGVYLDVRIWFTLDWESDTTLTGTMAVAFDSSEKSCSATYSVVLTKE